MTEQVRFVEVKGKQQRTEPLERHGIERIESRDHTAARAGGNQRQCRRRIARCIQQLSLHLCPNAGIATLRRLVNGLENDSGEVDAVQAVCDFRH